MISFNSLPSTVFCLKCLHFVKKTQDTNLKIITNNNISTEFYLIKIKSIKTNKLTNQ